MTSKHLTAILLAAIAVTVGLARAKRDAADVDVRLFPVAGVVTTPPFDGRVTVAHEAIEGYMPAMTMPFAVAGGAPALTPGDRIRFTLRVTAEASRAEGIEVIGRDEALASRLTAAAAAPRARLKRGDELPDFSLLTQQQRPFTAADVRGRVTAITFIFTRCPVPDFCPLMVKRFQQVQRELVQDASLGDVQLVSVTLDPAFDTPAVLDAYATAMRANGDRWRFVTGDAAEIARLTTAFAVHVEANGVLLDHTLATAIIDRDGRIVEIWRGNGWKVPEFLEVLRREAAVPGGRR